jgi:hypothetical protein
LELLALLFVELGFDRLGVGALAPIGGDEFGLEPDALGQILPQLG